MFILHKSISISSKNFSFTQVFKYQLATFKHCLMFIVYNFKQNIFNCSTLLYLREI